MTGAAWGQAPGGNVARELADLREDVRILVQRVGELNLRVEQLERENNALRSATSGLSDTYATVAQLNTAIAEVNRAIRTGNATNREQMTQAMAELTRQTNAAIDSLAKGMAQRAAVTPPTFSDNFPKEGGMYTVQRGDTISSIAARTGASVRDIINANRIADPTRLQVGQTLFIPGATQ
jgi:LysM repeat protein